MKKIFIIFFLFIISVSSVFSEENNQLPSIIGTIKKVEYVDIDNNLSQTKQIVDVEINKKQIITLDNMLTGNPYYDMNLKNGMKVVIHQEESNGELFYSIEDIYRGSTLLYLSLLFCGLLIYIGKKKGFYSLISIVITCFLVLNLLSHLILLQINPVISTILICILSTFITMILVGGNNTKSYSAIIGTSLSLLFAGFISFLTVKIAFLTGFNSEHTMFLYSAHPELNFVNILISTMLIATLGATMDVAMSIASTINEIYTLDNSKTFKELFLSGMNVGRDIIGTMANTLILVYLGSSLPLILLASNIDLQKFLNLNQVVAEISSALIGSSAIIITVPITAFVTSKLLKTFKPQNISINTID